MISHLIVSILKVLCECLHVFNALQRGKSESRSRLARNKIVQCSFFEAKTHAKRDDLVVELKDKLIFKVCN